MAGLTGLTIYRANFYNEEGKYTGSKTIKAKWNALEKTTFMHKKGTYLYDPEASRSKITPFPWFFDYEECNYTEGNPQPFTLEKELPENSIRAQDLRTILKSDALTKLNRVREGGLLALLTFRNIIILAIIIGLIWYFTSGADVGETLKQADIIAGLLLLKTKRIIRRNKNDNTK